MRPFFRQLGITRVARQTDLDDIGIPCYASFRPTSRTLSTNQGKGVGDDDAMASAVMEAVEFAVAEQPRSIQLEASLDELREREAVVFWPLRLLPPGFVLPTDKPIRWLRGQGLTSGLPCLVPLDCVSLSAHADDLPGICQSTNGLASGNTRDEAIFHALCELVERDGMTKWLLLSQAARNRTRFNPATLGDAVLDRLVERVVNAGKSVAFFDQSTDIGVPVVTAVMSEVTAGTRFELAAGSGAHLDAAHAARRALTEAAQTRVTSIAAARDDIPPDAFRQRMQPDGLELTIAVATPARHGPPSVPNPRDVAARIAAVARAVEGAGLAEPIVVDLDDGSMPCAVVRLLSSDLEDVEANLNWRPGARATSWMSV